MSFFEKIKKSIHRNIFLRLLTYLLVLAIAASVCVYGCFKIILKGPYDSYGPNFVKHICSETRFGFLCREILGDEAVEEIMANAVKEEQEK